MANFPQQVLSDINDGKEYYSKLNELFIEDLKRGCSDCVPKQGDALMGVLNSLIYKVSVDDYDTEAISLYTELMEMIGGVIYVGVPPQVSAGADRSASINIPQVFTAAITQGTAPIESILWTQISGTTATLTNANTASVTVSNFPLGVITLQVTVEDEDGEIATDTVTLTGVQASSEVLFGYSLTNPFGAVGSVTLNGSIYIQGGVSEYDITFPDASNLTYLVVREFATEPAKTYYENTINNYGSIPDSKWRQEVIGLYRYTYSRTPFAFDAESKKITFKQN